MPTSIVIDSSRYVCLHEAGHAAATYLQHGIVEFVEIIQSTNDRIGGRTRTNLPPTADGKTIASAGFAIEYLLFKEGRIVSSDGEPITEKGFIDAAINNAAEDKVNFFGANHMQGDGTWPEEMDREYMIYGIQIVAPCLKPMLGKVEAFAAALECASRLEQAQIEELLL